MAGDEHLLDSSEVTLVAGKTLNFLLALWLLEVANPASGGEGGRFVGRHYRGKGGVEYAELLETSRRLFEPDPELPNLSMLYTPRWRRCSRSSTSSHESPGLTGCLQEVDRIRGPKAGSSLGPLFLSDNQIPRCDRRSNLTSNGRGCSR